MRNANINQTNDRFNNYNTKSEDVENFYYKGATNASDCLKDTITPGIYIYGDDAINRPLNEDGNGGVILTIGFLKMWTTRIAVSNSLRLFLSLHIPGTSYGEWKEL